MIEVKKESYSEILKLVIKMHSNAEIERITGASKKVIYNLRKMYNIFLYETGRMNELEQLIYFGKNNQEIQNETSYIYEEIKKARKKLCVRSPKSSYESNYDEIGKLVMADLSNKDIKLQLKCSDHAITKIRKRLQKPSPSNRDKVIFEYKKHHPNEPRIKADKALDDMIAFGFTVDEISYEYNYGRDVVLQRYTEIHTENNA